MQIHVNTDDSIQGRERLAQWVSTEVSGVLDRFAAQVTRVEVHLADENKGKAGERDKRCMMEARLAGQQPVAVTQQAPTLEEAVTGAAEKLERALSSTLGRLRDQAGRETIRREDEP